MSLFDDDMLNEDIDLNITRAEALVKRAQRAADDLGLPVHVGTDEVGLKIIITSWRRVPECDADRMVRMLEDLAAHRCGEEARR